MCVCVCVYFVAAPMSYYHHFTYSFLTEAGMLHPSMPSKCMKCLPVDAMDHQILPHCHPAYFCMPKMNGTPHNSPLLSALAISYPPRIPCAADPFPIIVQHLIWHTTLHQQGIDTDGFVRRAVESLVKKLKKRYNELDALITAIASKVRIHLASRLQIRTHFPAG